MAMTAATAPVGPPRRRRARRRRLLAIGAVAAVVVLVYVASDLVGPYAHPGAPVARAGPPLPPNYANASFGQDRPVAASFVANLSNGPWELVGGRAITSGTAGAMPLDASGASSCPLIPSPYPSRTNFSIPSDGAADGRGVAPIWTFDYVGADGSGVRVQVDDGNASLLGHLDFNRTGCGAPGTQPVLVPPGPVDSTTAADAALAAGGTAFLTEYPGATVSYALVPRLEPGRSGSVVDEWNVTFNGCGLGPSPGLYSMFGELLTVWLDGATAELESSAEGAVTCPVGPGAPVPYGLADALAFNAPVRAPAGPVTFLNDSVAAVCCGLTLDNLSANLHPVGNGSGAPPSATLRVLAPTGGTLCTAYADRSGAFSWDCSNAVAPGDLFSLEVPSTGTGAFVLALVGLWDFSGELVVPFDTATTI